MTWTSLLLPRASETGTRGGRTTRQSRWAPLAAAIKRYDPLVLALRSVRQARRFWTILREERRREVCREHQMDARGVAIERYLAETRRYRKLQIGAGENVLPGWLNTDVEPVAEGVIFLDAAEAFPFDDAVFDYMFCEHTIEHVTYKAGLFMLKEAARVMKPGARIRIATPDAERIAGLLSPVKTQDQEDYVRWSAVESLGLYSAVPSKLQERRPEWALDVKHIRHCFPEPGHDCACFVVNNFFRSYGHLFLYDEKTLAAAMQEAGFALATRVEPGRSEDPELDGIEWHGRVIGDGINRFETMVVEARR